MTTQDLLTSLNQNTTKTINVDCGLPTRKRLKVSLCGDTLKVHTFIYHNRAAGGRDEFPFTSDGMKELNDYIKFWFSEKNKPSPSTGWSSLTTLMNKTWRG